MNKVIYHIIFIFCLWLTPELSAQNEAYNTRNHAHLTSFLPGTNNELSVNQINKLEHKVANFIANQKQKQAQSRSEVRFLRQLNKQIHEQFLKKYKHFSSFTGMLQTGNYDCLSGVIFYAVLLDTLGYDYTVYQTNFHVYLMVKTTKRTILIETTDPIYGFVDNPYYIQKRKKEYEKTVEKIENQGSNHISEMRLHQPTSLKELVALQYYNQAVKCYNKRQLDKAYYFLNKTEQIYASQRTKEMRQRLDFYSPHIFATN